MITNMTIFYDDFIFKCLGQGASSNILIFEVYPKSKFDPSTFLSKIIYNDKLRFNLSLILGQGIMDMKGYVTLDEVEKIYKMALEITMSMDEAIYNDMMEYEHIPFFSEFRPNKIGEYTMPLSISGNILKKDDDIHQNFIENNMYMFDISLTGVDNELYYDEIYDMLIPYIEDKINNLINPLRAIDVGFSKLYLASFTENGDTNNLLAPKYNLSLKIFFVIDSVDGYTLAHLSSSRIIADQKIFTDHNLTADEITKYFYKDYPIYREKPFVTNVAHDTITGITFVDVRISNVLCNLNDKKMKLSNMKVVNFNKRICGEDTDPYHIYKTSDIFNTKYKYFGFVNRPRENYDEFIESISSNSLFKNRSVKILNITNDYLYFLLIPNKI